MVAAARPEYPVRKVRALIPFLLAIAVHSAGTQTVVLSGNVSADSIGRHPLAGAMVTLPALQRTATTNAAGDYRFAGVRPGRYLVTVQIKDYQSSRDSVSVASSGDTYRDFVLAPAETYNAQVLIVFTFSGADHAKAHKAADIVRNRVNGAFPHDELRVISADDVADWLNKSGIDEDAPLTAAELRAVTTQFRADERVTGAVTSTPRGIRVDAWLSTVRDLHTVQPFSAEAPTVEAAAAVVAQEVAAARRQFTPQRRCENLARGGQFAQAADAAAEGVAAYPRSTFARVCLLTSLVRLPNPPRDSVIAIAQAVLAITPADPLALEALATALEWRGDFVGATRAWISLFATDSLNEALIARVVTALAREGSAKQAQPIIDRAVASHPTNASLLRLRWLVHLATSDWKAAIEAGEGYLAADSAARSDSDVYLRLAGAYRADSQPQRALSVAATGVGRFPNDASLYELYADLLMHESRSALGRGLARFPASVTLHVLAAQSLSETGQMESAAREMRLALAANPALPHGYIQLADYEIGAGHPDSAYRALELATIRGEPAEVVARFALAKGDALFRAASAIKRRQPFEVARRFLVLSQRLEPTAAAAFLIGASSLSIAQAATTEASEARNCELLHLANASLTDAEQNLKAGESVDPGAMRQYLDYVNQLRPYVAGQIKTSCGG
jgi:tetratricopeptide (TPR) repeat protein